MVKIEESSKPINVKSAFGGLGIYKKSLFEKSYYCGLSADGSEVCEHVSFHELLHEEGHNMYINPKLINCIWNEHNKNLKFIVKIKAQLRYYSLALAIKFALKENIKEMLNRQNWQKFSEYKKT